jgi:hypothetical protein
MSAPGVCSVYALVNVVSGLHQAISIDPCYVANDKGDPMIAVYVQPESLTVEQYNKARTALEASEASVEGRKHHSCFGEDGQLMVFEIWESQESYDAFLQYLRPVLQKVGITPKNQDIMSVVNLEQ